MKILLVDDERDLVEIVTLRLQANGYEVIPAYDGDEAFRKAKEVKPDLIMLDLMLPKMDGYKVCGLLKSDARHKHIPILIFTARAQEVDRKLAEEAGADAYLVKPFEPSVLMDKIKGLFEKR